MTQNLTTGTNLTPANVKVEVGLIKRYITLYFAKQGKEVVGVRMNYSNFFASSSAEHFVNDGEPVAYLIFSDATFADGEPLTNEQINEALGYARSAIPAELALPMEFVEAVRKVKIRTASLYDEQSRQHRPSTVAVEKQETV